MIPPPSPTLTEPRASSSTHQALRLTTHRAALELPLEAELGLAGIQRLDEAAVGGEAVIRAHAEGIGVVGEVVEADAEQEDAVVLPPLEALGRRAGRC